jgi:hypothetical protein
VAVSGFAAGAGVAVVDLDGCAESQPSRDIVAIATMNGYNRFMLDLLEDPIVPIPSYRDKLKEQDKKRPPGEGQALDPGGLD